MTATTRQMKPPLWLHLLHAAAHAAMVSTEQLFLLVTEPRSGSDWLVDLLDARQRRQDARQPLVRRALHARADRDVVPELAVVVAAARKDCAICAK